MDEITLSLALCALGGCSHLGMRMGDAATVAAQDPWTWAPLAGAAAVVVTNSDRRISNWATTQTPLFGSENAADDASNRFRAASSTGAWLTFLWAKQRGEGPWLREKAIDGAGNLAGLATARATTGFLKSAVGRERPQDESRTSFPSEHASDAFAHATIGRHYSDLLPG